MGKSKDFTKEQLKAMLSKCFELEGLLTLAIHRGDTTPQQIWDMIYDHTKSLHQAAVEESPSLPFDDIEEDIEDFEAAAPAAEPETQAQTQADEQAVATSVVEEEVEDAEPAAEETEAQEPAAEVAGAAVTTPDEEAEAEAAETEEAEDADLQATTMTEETGKREISVTLGDKFLFIRELFDGSEAEYKSALDTLSLMHNKTEIEDYLYNDLCFDEMNPTVKSFAATVTANIK